MTITVKHTKVSTVADGPNTTLVRPSDWNADHTLTGLGTAAELNAGVANGAATLDSGGTVPLSQIPASIQGTLSYQGTWNASTNTPTLASGVGTKGYFYVVSVAGSTNLDGITDWNVGDMAVYSGTAWQQIDNTDAVTSVNGYTGTVSLTYTDVGAQPAGTYVTSVAATVPSFLSVSGSPVTSAGTLAITYSGTALPVANGGTGLTSLASNYIPYGAGTSALSSSANLTFDGSTLKVTGDQHIRSGYGVAFFDAANSGYWAQYNSSGNFIFSNGSEKMRIDSSGNVGIGTSSPIAKLDVNNQIFARPSTTAESGEIIAAASDYISLPSYKNTAIRQYGSTATGTFYGFSKASLGLLEFVNTSVGVIGTNGATPIVFATAATERMRIDPSGNVLVGTTTWLPGYGNTTTGISFGGDTISVSKTGNINVTVNNNTAGNSLMWCAYQGVEKGGISLNGSTGVSFNTTSDYRLKENVQPMQNALAKVAQLNPVTYNWKTDGSEGQGFIAHELQAVVPDCVTGEKDAMRTEQYEISPAIPETVDEDGKILTPAIAAVMGEREVPSYQGIDTSFLIATLTKAIQELNAKVDAQAAEIAALKAA